MLSGLLITAFLMGLGGLPHCAVMCGAPCAAAFPRGLPLLALVGRALGYAALGGAAAASAGLVAAWGRELTVLQPFWVMAQFGAVLFGLWLLWKGRVPAWLDRFGIDVYHGLRRRFASSPLLADGGQRSRAVVTLLAGMVWALMPCGLLYGALMVAVLAPTAWGGALVMLSFAVASSAGVWFAPAVLAWLRRRLAPGAQGAHAASGPAAASSTGGAPVLWLRTEGGASPDGSGLAPRGAAPEPTLVDPRWALRASGVALAAMAAWGLSHHLAAQWRAWCA